MKILTLVSTTSMADHDWSNPAVGHHPCSANKMLNHWD